MRATVFLLILCSILCFQTVVLSDVQVINPPTTNPILSDALSFSTYIGGSNNDTVHCVVVDDEGYVYIAGSTESNDLPSSGGPKIPFSGYSDYYVMKLTNECEVVYTTYIGGSSTDGSPDLHPDGGCWIDVDDSGRVYMTGNTDSLDFPNVNAWDNSHNGFADCFALKLSSSGATIEYATFLGGSQNDIGNTIAVDDLGNAYITGWTASPDFPTLAAFDDRLNGSHDNFLVKLDPSGQLNYSTYVGGGVNEYSHAGALVVDDDGTTYITGSTSSSDFPTVNAYDDSANGISGDIFFCKVNSTGHLLASSFFGGSSSESCGGIAVDDAGNIYVSGYGTGDFPKTKIFDDNSGIFIAKFDSSGKNLIYSAAFGGFGAGNPYGLEVDEDDCVFTTGITYSSDFPMVNAYDDTRNGTRDAFLLKLSSGGDNILFSSYIGGNNEELGLSVTKSASGSVYLTGITTSTDFPTASPLVSTNQNIDGFLIRLEDTWPDIPSEPTSPSSPSPSSPTSPSPTTPGNWIEPPSFGLTVLLSFGIGIEIVIIIALASGRRRPRSSG